MLLLEGQSENLLRHSESPNNTDAWTPDPTWPFTIESAVVDPRGGTSAERLRSPAGGGEGPVQSASSGDVATTFSAWLRQEPASVGGTERTPVRARIVPSSGGVGVV